MSEALRLAAILEDEKMHSMAIDTEAAAELRRLHTDNQGLYHAIAAEAKKVIELEALNAELVEALRRCRDMVGHPDNLAFIDAALAKVEASNGS